MVSYGDDDSDVEMLRDLVTALQRRDLWEIIEDQIEWSGKTFGPGKRTIGITEHIKKELKEILKDPDDVYEWIDVVILALDGAWRSGHTATEIVDALLTKIAKNRKRQWPTPTSEDEPVEHVKNETQEP